MSREDSLFYGMILIACAVWTYDTVIGFDQPLVRQPEPVSVERIVRFSEVQPIFQQRCLRCHSSPHWDWTNYDVAFKKKDRIKSRVWISRSMPLGNPMPEVERELVRDWVDGGGEK